MTETGAGALDGLRIIDLTSVVAGPSCAQALGDHGADVIKIESPTGDDSRHLGPPFLNGKSVHFQGLNRNKRSVALDLKTENGRQVLLRLLEDADVLLESFKPHTLSKLGLGYDEVLKERFPRLVYCCITGFGANGPLGGLPGYDAVAQAFAGIPSFCGEPDGEPLRLGLSVVDMIAGVRAGLAIMMAIHERHRSGLGQALEVTLFDTALSISHPYSTNWLMAGIKPKRYGNRHPSTAPFDVYRARDGHILLCLTNSRQFIRLCESFGRPELAVDPRFATNADRVQNMEALNDEIESLFAPHDKMELAMKLMREGVPAGPILDLDEALAQPQVAARDMILEGEGGFKVIGMPVKFSRTPGRLRRLPPRFGEHNRDVLRDAGFADDEIDALIAGKVLVENSNMG